MKYPQLVSDRAVSTISDWLITRLEVLGVEAPIVYSRLLLSLLHTPLQVNSLDVAEIPQLKNWLGKRFNSRRLTQSDAERLKRVAAIESLMEVVEANEKRSRIVDLVSELCGKLRELERSEEEDVELVAAEREVQEEHKVRAEENTTVAGGRGGARNKDLIGDRGKRSNPYYQMFPALSGGNVPPPASSGGSSQSSRGASLSGIGTGTGPAATMNNNVELNWGRGDNLQRSKWRMEPATAAGGGEAMLTNGSPTTMTLEGERAGGAGDKGGGSTKRKNKKRRTNGPSSADKKSFATSSPSNLKIKLSGQLSNGIAGCRKLSTSTAAEEVHFQQQYRQQRSKYVEWDTNFSGQWEMEEQDPIKEFLNAQRTTKTAATAAAASDCESMASVQLRGDDGYDNVFKMKRSDVNEEQTMLIKSFLKQKTMNCDTTKNTASSTEMMQMPPLEADKEEVVAFGFNLVETEEYFNLISPIEGAVQRNGTSPAGGRGGRLFEREVSSELSSLSHGMSVGVEVEEERLASEFDAKLDAFKAKFDTNIRNLWSQEGAEVEVVVDDKAREEQEFQQQQPMSVNSFWQNYNKHLYEVVQDGGGVANCALDSNNNCGGNDVLLMNGGWLMGGGVGSGVLGPQPENSFNLNTFQQQSHSLHQGQPTTIWSNNDLSEYEEQQQAEVESRRHCMQQYNEHMAAAYQKQMELGFGMCAPTNMEQLDLFAAAKWAAADGCSSSIDVGGGGSLDASMNDRELEQLYYSSSFPGCDYDLAPEANIGQTVDNQLHQSIRDGMMAADLKLEQSIAMINHSSTSSFAKVDRKWTAAGVGPRPHDSSSSITNLSSLYGSFKQNSMENLLTSERTHFRPIKQAYIDGHTFDIPSSPDTIEYVRSASGSIFFELDKYMEYTVTEHGTDAYDEQQRSTNVPISRCGTIEEKERGIPVERAEEEVDVVADAPKNNFTLKFCVRSQNEKCCQTEVIDYEQMQRIETSNSLLLMGRAATMRKYPTHVLPSECTLSYGRAELLEDQWKVGGSYKNHHNNNNNSDLSMLWENSGDSNSLDSFSLNCYESLPANRLLRDELSGEMEEILKDSLTYMQNLYIDDMEGDEQEADVEEEEEQEKNGMANYYEMGQLISEILNPGTVKQIAQVAAATVGENDVLWYKNWSLGRSWLDENATGGTAADGDDGKFCKARNVWHYGHGNGNGNGGHVNGGEVFNNFNCNSAATITSDNNNNCLAEGAYEVIAGEEGSGDEQRETAAGDWKFSSLRMLWNDTQMVLNGVGEEEEEGQHAKKERKSLVIEEVHGGGGDEEYEGELDQGEELLLQAEEKNYHLIIFEKKKKDPSAILSSAAATTTTTVVKGGRKRRHSASQNLFDDDLELFNGDDVKWYDYCCKCDCGKRSEKILRYRNKLLMKRVDKMGYVHNNASLLLKNFSKQFDSIDEILNEGLICSAAAAALGEICAGDYEGEYCGDGFTAEKLNNLEQVSLLKNPNMYLNRTALISMARPLTR